MTQYDVKPAIISHCTATETILAAFGHRIFPDYIPDGQGYPKARILQVGNDQRYHLQGESGRKVLIQFDIYDDDLAGADANAELVRNAFSGYRGQMGNVNAGMVTAKIVSGEWNETARNFHRLLQIEIGTSN